MPHELSESTRQRIAEYCRKISVAHNLDPEIQRELAGHMEDKILGYLSGEEKLTESDAFVIARERFGDPALLKQMLGGVHAGAAAVSLARRLLAIVLLSKVIGFASMVILFPLKLFSPITIPGGLPLFFLFGWLNLWVTFQILKRWRRMLTSGFSTWFLRWPVSVMVMLVLFFVALIPFSIVFSPVFNGRGHPAWITIS